MNNIQWPWQKWIFFWDVALALLAAVFVFVFLDLISGGFLISTLIAAAVLVAVGTIHYFFWGRLMSANAALPVSVPELPPLPVSPPSHHEILDEITVNLDERERVELLRLLDCALKTAANPSPQANIDRQLFDKLRMFGA